MQIPETQEDTDGWANNEASTKLRDGSADTEEQEQAAVATTRRTKLRHYRSHNMSDHSSLRERSRATEQHSYIEDQQESATETHPGIPFSAAGTNEDSGKGSAEQVKRKATTTNSRNQRRNTKRVRSYQHQQGELHIFGGRAPPDTNTHAVPWEHRGLLGQTRAGIVGVDC